MNTAGRKILIYQRKIISHTSGQGQDSTKAKRKRTKANNYIYTTLHIKLTKSNPNHTKSRSEPMYSISGNHRTISVKYQYYLRDV